MLFVSPIAHVSNRFNPEFSLTLPTRLPTRLLPGCARRLTHWLWRRHISAHSHHPVRCRLRRWYCEVCWTLPPAKLHRMGDYGSWLWRHVYRDGEEFACAIHRHSDPRWDRHRHDLGLDTAPYPRAAPCVEQCPYARLPRLRQTHGTGQSCSSIHPPPTGRAC